MISSMQFRDYVFRSNPQSITVKSGTETAVHFCPGQGDVVQNLGSHRLTVECRGSFWGDSFQTALSQLEAFRRGAEQREAGCLFIPGMPPLMAHLRSLTFEVNGDGKIIPYVMEFREAEEGA